MLLEILMVPISILVVEWFFSRSVLLFFHPGICTGASPRNFDPVRGSDGNTYDNERLLNYASCKSGGKIKKVSDGKCRK